MSDLTKEQQQLEKVAKFQDTMFEQVYVPALVMQYNEKAAAAGLDPISSEDDLNTALDLVAAIESHEMYQGSQKQASSLVKTAQTLSGASRHPQAQNQEVLAKVAQAAAESEEVVQAVKSLLS